MSDTKEIKETEVKEATFAILPPQLQRIIYLTKYLSVFCFSKLSSALFQGVHHNICRYIRVCQTVRKKTFCRQTHRRPVHYRDSSQRHTDSHASLRMAFSIPHPALLYKQTDAFFRHSAFHCRPVICLILTFPLYIRKAGDGKLYIKTDVMPNDNDD